MGVEPQDHRRSGTRVMDTKPMLALAAAVDETNQKRSERYEGVNPTFVFIWGIVRKGLLGMPLAGAGFWRFYVESQSLDKLLAIAGRAFHFTDLIRFIPSGLLLFVAYWFFAPAHIETMFRFLGVGGIVDKVIDRLPFLRPRATAAPIDGGAP